MCAIIEKNCLPLHPKRFKHHNYGRLEECKDGRFPYCQGASAGIEPGRESALHVLSPEARHLYAETAQLSSLTHSKGDFR